MVHTPGILVAAHDHDERTSIEAAISLWNLDHRLSFAPDEDEVMSHLEAGRREHRGPDLLIVDHALPPAGGVALVTRLRAIPWLITMPIIVVSGDVSDELLARFLHARASTVLRKPVDPDAYQSLMCSLLDYWLILDEGGKGTARKGTNQVTLTDGGCA
ncbi:MAG: response regulator [Myxococcota bacterium]